MIHILLFFLLIFPSYSSVNVELDFAVSVLKQGELLEARLQIQSAENWKPELLRGKTLGKTVYFYDISPLLKREGRDIYEADAKIIFVKVPESTGLQEKVEGDEIGLHWGNVRIVPTEEGGKLLFGAFEVPEKSEWIFWLSSALAFVVLVAFFSWNIGEKVKRKRKEKERLVALKNEILGCRNYEDIVSLWKKKHLLFNCFPHVNGPFLRMEEVLNRHQFKPRLSEAEKIEVVESYRKFSRVVEGGFNGI